MLGKLAALPADLGKPETLLADTGYFSAANVQACGVAGIEPLIALGREAHHPSLSERFAEAPAAPDDPTAVEAMAHRLKTGEGRKLYALRKHISGTGVRHHQVGPWLPSVPAARTRQGAGRVEPGDPGVEPEEPGSPALVPAK